MYEWIGKITGEGRGMQTFTRWMPRRLVVGICALCSLVIYAAAKSVRQQVIGNMLELLKDCSFPEVKRCCRAYFFNLCLTLYEIVIDSPSSGSGKRRRFQVEGEAFLEQALSRGNGAILFAPHVGNFFYYYWYLSQKYRCMTVATAGSPELRPLYMRFQAMGCTGLDYDTTPPLELLRTLRRHLKEGGVVLLLGDFYRPSFPEAILFDRLTRSPAGTAALALELKVPVIPFYGFRTKGLCHRLVFEQPVFLYEEFARHQRVEATNKLNRIMENTIVSVPEQWFYWFNAQQRWEPELYKGKAAPKEGSGWIRGVI